MEDLKHIDMNAGLQSRIKQVGRNTQSQDHARADDAAAQFEAIFARMMLNEMRKAMAPEGLFGEGQAGDIFQSLLEERLGEVIARRGQLGIADMLKRQLGLEQQTADAEPLSNDELNNIVQQAASETGLDERLIKAVIQQESGGNPAVVSKAGAKGMMQLMDGTAFELGVKNVFDARENVLAGSRYLKQQLERFGDLEHALAAYNAGPGAVEKYNGIPPYKETRNYVESILLTLKQDSQNGSGK